MTMWGLGHPYAVTLWYASPLSLEPAVFLPLVALACTGLIVAGYFLSLPATNAFYAAVNRTRGFSFYWVYTRLLMRTCAAGDKLRAAQENLQTAKRSSINVFFKPTSETRKTP